MNKYTVSVTVEAPTKEQAHSAIGYILRTDTTMHTLQELPCMDDVHIEWESLTAKGFEENIEVRTTEGVLRGIDSEPLSLCINDNHHLCDIRVRISEGELKKIDLSLLGKRVIVRKECNGYGVPLKTEINKADCD